MGIWKPMLIGYEAFTATELPGPIIVLTPSWRFSHTESVFKQCIIYDVGRHAYERVSLSQIASGPNFGGRERATLFPLSIIF